MTLYSRGDVQHVYVTGGCGASHTRPVTHGAPAKTFELTCPPCERILNGDREVLEFSYRKDKDGHLVTNSQGHAIQEGIKKVRNRDPLWSNDPNELPKTGPEVAAQMAEDEKKADQKEKLEEQGRMLSTFAALMQIPGTDPVKLASSLGIDLEALGIAGPKPENKPPIASKPVRGPRARAASKTE